MQINPTIDQLQVFLAVVQCGSFSAAARKLNRTQSVISYTIANLEAQVGLPLFERERTKAPVLTAGGKAMVEEAGRIVHSLDHLRARARGLQRGLEAEVSLAVDVMLPPIVLTNTLQAFQEEFATVALRLHVSAMGGVAKITASGGADIGISGLAASFANLARKNIGKFELLPVAAPSHPLGQMVGPLSEEHVKDHTQLVLTDPTSFTKGRDFNVFSLRTWRLGDLGVKHELLRAGLGWGSMPAPMIRDDLISGRLVELDLLPWPRLPYECAAIYATGSSPGPAARWLIERFELEFKRIL